MIFLIVIFGSILSTSSGKRRHYDMLDAVNINDVFPKIPDYFKANESQVALHIKDSIDMSKISDYHLNKTISEFQSIYENATGYNISIINDVEEELFNETKIHVLNNTRRFALNGTRRNALPWHGPDDWMWNWASVYIARQKMIDCMLTLIYMARHHVITMAKQQINAPHDDAYRMAYLFTKLQILKDRMISVYNSMAQKAYKYGWDIEWDRAYYFLMLHQKALKIHLQANFYFWIIAKTHHKYSLINQLYQTTPTTRQRPKRA